MVVCDAAMASASSSSSSSSTTLEPGPQDQGCDHRRRAGPASLACGREKPLSGSEADLRGPARVDDLGVPNGGGSPSLLELSADEPPRPEASAVTRARKFVVVKKAFSGWLNRGGRSSSTSGPAAAVVPAAADCSGKDDGDSSSAGKTRISWSRLKKRLEDCRPRRRQQQQQQHLRCGRVGPESPPPEAAGPSQPPEPGQGASSAGSTSPQRRPRRALPPVPDRVHHREAEVVEEAAGQQPPDRDRQELIDSLLNDSGSNGPIAYFPSEDDEDDRHQDGREIEEDPSLNFDLTPRFDDQSGPHHHHHHHQVVDVAASLERVKSCGWYWGPISREAAEKLLEPESDGSFIVRDSSADHYIFSLSFKLNGNVCHVRIEHDQGTFSFGSFTRFRSKTIVDFIENAVRHSRSGRYLFFMHRRPERGPMRVQLLNPVSRFKMVQSLQHMCRFVILKLVPRDRLRQLPVPKRIRTYLDTPFYYSETTAGWTSVPGNQPLADTLEAMEDNAIALEEEEASGVHPEEGVSDLQHSLSDAKALEDGGSSSARMTSKPDEGRQLKDADDDQG